MSKPLYVAAILAALVISSCATIIHGSKQNVVIGSEPSSAAVSINGLKMGKTPFLARLERGQTHMVTIEMKGYKPYELRLDRKLDGWIFGNIIFGGTIGVIIDAVTGSMYRLTPKDIYGELQKGPAVAGKKGEGLYVAVTLKPEEGWEKIGQLERSVETEVQ